MGINNSGAREVQHHDQPRRFFGTLLLHMNDVQLNGLYGIDPSLTNDNRRSVLACLSAGAASSEISSNVGFNSDSWHSRTGQRVGGFSLSSPR